MFWTWLLGFFYSKREPMKPPAAPSPEQVVEATAEPVQEDPHTVVVTDKPQTASVNRPPASNVGLMLAARHKVSIYGPIFSVDSLGFTGVHSKSPSGRWVIACDDSNGARGGSRDSGYGSYILYNTESNSIDVQGKRLQRPNNGSVSDSGVFALEDWLFGNDLSGVFYVFSPAGEVILTRTFTANILNSAISDNGLFAACHTAGGHTEDSNRLVFFDIANACEAFSFQSDIERPQGYEFDEERRELILDFKNIGKFRYSYSGDFLDAQKYKDAKLNSTDDFTAIREAEELLKDPSLTVEKVREILAIVSSALPRVGKFHPHWKATALKVQGLAHEKLGEPKKAIKAYQEAIALNPKVGVKRKLDALRKKNG